MPGFRWEGTGIQARRGGGAGRKTIQSSGSHAAPIPATADKKKKNPYFRIGRERAAVRKMISDGASI